MKRNFSFPQQFHAGILGLALGFVLLIAGSASAQNKVYNPGFELPIGTNAYGNALGGANFPLGIASGGEVYDPSWRSTGNWKIAYPLGGPEDFECKDRCTQVPGPPYSSLWSAHLRPAHNKLAHAYYTQTVTNLTQAHSYLVQGYMVEEFWGGVGDPKRTSYLVYIEAIGGQGTATGDGRFSVILVAIDQSSLDPPYTYPNLSWLIFTGQQTPAADGTIEIRLHYNKCGWVLPDKLELMGGYFDDISLTP